jgi:hypothetical protein
MGINGAPLLASMASKLSMSIAEMPKMLGVSKRTVDRYLRGGRMAKRIKDKAEALLEGDAAPRMTQPRLPVRPEPPFQGDPFNPLAETCLGKFSEVAVGSCFISEHGSTWRRIPPFDMSRVRWNEWDELVVNAVKVFPAPDGNPHANFLEFADFSDDKCVHIFKK